jgi:hypothetical protein
VAQLRYTILAYAKMSDNFLELSNVSICCFTQGKLRALFTFDKED